MSYFTESLYQNVFQYYFVHLIYLIVVMSLYFYNFPFIGIWLIYGLFPILDVAIKKDLKNPTKEECDLMENQIKYKVPVLLGAITDIASNVLIVYIMATRNLSILQIIGFIIVGANMSTVGINISHELMHKKNFERFIGLALLGKSMNIHFYVEHQYGHHKNVSTPKDPAFASINMSVYRFVVKSWTGQFKSIWNICSRELIKKNQPIFSVKNAAVWYFLGNLVYPVLVYKYIGALGLIYATIIAMGSQILLEFINYIEHYGLQRKEIRKGIYEPVTEQHSWNAPNRITNYVLFKLQRHSDHHANSHKPYQILLSYDDSPNLPHGYAFCILLAAIPCLWKKVIHISLKAHQERRRLSNEENKRMNFYIWLTTILFFVASSILIIIGLIQQKGLGMKFNFFDLSVIHIFDLWSLKIFEAWQI